LGQFDDARAVVQKALRGGGLASIAGSQSTKEIERKLAEIAEIENRLRGVLQSLDYDISLGTGVESRGGKGKQVVALEVAFEQLEQLAGHVPHAEAFHAARAGSLLRQGRLGDAVAAISSAPHADATDVDASAAWRVWIRAQLAFFNGRGEETRKIVEIVAQSVTAKGMSPPRPSDAAMVAALVPLPAASELAQLVTCMSEADRLKELGNKAISEGKYDVAVESYTAALAVEYLSPAMAAVLHCNRAAAHQGLGQGETGCIRCATFLCIFGWGSVPAFSYSNVLLDPLSFAGVASEAAEAYSA